MAGLVLSNSLLFLFFFWEITALCSYALISYYNDDPKAVSAGIEALIMTQVGGVGLLGGALLTYASLGTYEIDVFLAAAGKMAPLTLAWMAFGFLVAAAAKSAQFPFQTWLPDAMEAPTPVSALIHAATMVNAGVYLLARFYPAFAPVPGWKTAVVAGSWQIGEIVASQQGRWALLTQPFGFVVAIIGLMGKLEMPPFDAPKAKSEIVAGALTEYSGRGLGFFHLAKEMELVVGMTLIAALYMGGIANPLEFFIKTLILLAILASLHCVLTRLRIDQTVGLWWRYGAVVVLLQWLVLIAWRGMVA
jgi:NADH:ubiquinone oxidoreductase subunit 5 (subunit L)/multisubunit Na+/H+ antiporter MnhA subunit